MGTEVGESIYRWSSKLAIGQIFLPKTGWTATGRSDRLLPVWLSNWLADWPAVWPRLTRPVEPPPRAVEPPLTPLATCLPVWLADFWLEVRGVKDQLNCPSGPVQPVLTREFRRENSISTARRQVHLVYGQRGSLLKLSSAGVEKAQLSLSSAQVKSWAVAEEAQLRWSSAQL
jgi:hypothetical protein